MCVKEGVAMETIRTLRRHRSLYPVAQGKAGHRGIKEALAALAWVGG